MGGYPDISYALKRDYRKILEALKGLGFLAFFGFWDCRSIGFGVCFGRKLPPIRRTAFEGEERPRLITPDKKKEKAFIKVLYPMVNFIKCGGNIPLVAMCFLLTVGGNIPLVNLEMRLTRGINHPRLGLTRGKYPPAKIHYLEVFSMASVFSWGCTRKAGVPYCCHRSENR